MPCLPCMGIRIPGSFFQKQRGFLSKNSLLLSDSVLDMEINGCFAVVAAAFSPCPSSGCFVVSMASSTSHGPGDGPRVRVLEPMQTMRTWALASTCVAL